MPVAPMSPFPGGREGEGRERGGRGLLPQAGRRRRRRAFFYNTKFLEKRHAIITALCTP